MTQDPRGPIRTIAAVEKRPNVALVTLSCGHVGHFNPVYRYTINADARCMECLKKETVQ